MASTTINHAPSRERNISGTHVLLIVAPLVMALGRALLVPLDDEDWDSVMTSMAANSGRSNTGWLLALAASGLLAATAVLLAQRLKSAGKTRMAMLVTATTAIGWASCAGLSVWGVYLSVAADAPDRVAQVQLAEDFNDSAGAGVGFLMIIIAAIAYVVLAVGLARSSVVTRGAAVLIAVGGAATLLTAGGPLTPLLVLAALLLAAGHALATRTET
jgi:hypothetical protein